MLQFNDILLDEIAAHYAEDVFTDIDVLEFLESENPGMMRKIISFFYKSAQRHSEEQILARASRSYIRSFKQLANSLEKRNKNGNALTRINSQKMQDPEKLNEIKTKKALSETASKENKTIDKNAEKEYNTFENKEKQSITNLDKGDISGREQEEINQRRTHKKSTESDEKIQNSKGDRRGVQRRNEKDGIFPESSIWKRQLELSNTPKAFLEFTFVKPDVNTVEYAVVKELEEYGIECYIIKKEFWDKTGVAGAQNVQES